MKTILHAQCYCGACEHYRDDLWCWIKTDFLATNDYKFCPNCGDKLGYPKKEFVLKQVKGSRK